MLENAINSESKELLEQASVTGLFYYPIKSCGGYSVEVAQITPTGIRHDREFMIVESESGKFVSQREHPALAQITPQVEKGIIGLSAPGIESVISEIITAENTRLATIWRDTVTVADQGDVASAWLSDYLHADVRLVHMARDQRRQTDQNYARNESDEVNFADGYPFLLVSEESLDDLNNRLSSSVPMNRFRPNIVIKGSGIPFGEDMLKTLQLGDLTFDAVKLCARCVVTTTDQQTGERAVKGDEMFGEPLKTLVKYRTLEYTPGKRGAIFGHNLTHRYNREAVSNSDMVGTVGVGDRLKVIDLQ